MRHIILYFCATAICFCFSCKKYLDQKPDDKLSVPNTIEAMQALLDNTDKMNTKTASYGEASCDNYFILEATYNGRSDREKKVYQWKDPEFTYGTDWSNNYEPIYVANLCMEQLQKITKTTVNTAAWNQVMGASLFFRAYYFQQLAWVYAKSYDDNTSSTDLGIVLRLSSDYNEPSVRASVKASYERIVQDAREAVDYLPASTPIPTRPTKAAAYGLLARTYLSMRRYDSALKYANLTLGLKNDLLDFNSADVKPAATFPFLRFNNETIFYSQMTLLGLMSISNALIDTALYNTYVSDDIRKQAYFLPRSGYQRFKGSYSANGSYFSGIATDEIMLVKAESLAHTGDKDAAMQVLNDLLRTRWKKINNVTTYVDQTATDAADALHKILTERRKELLFRGSRWIDIKRLNKEGYAITPKHIIAGQAYVLPPNSNWYALPLPIDIIELTGMPQN